MPFYAEVVVIIIGIVDVFVSIFLQRKIFIDEEKMYKSQIAMKKFSGEMKEMVKNNASPDELRKKQNEMMPLISSNMQFSLKSAIPSLILFLGIYYVALPYVYKAIAPAYMKATVPFLSFNLNYLTLFLATIFILGIIVAIFISIRDKKNIKKLEAKMAAEEGRIKTDISNDVKVIDTDLKKDFGEQVETKNKKPKFNKKAKKLEKINKGS